MLLCPVLPGLEVPRMIGDASWYHIDNKALHTYTLCNVVTLLQVLNLPCL